MKGINNFKSESILSKDNRKASQGYVNIEKKSKEELEELLERQNKLLFNRWFIEKLPDKGKKLLSFKTQLENELKKRQEEYDATCNLFFKLNLNDSEHIEWNQGKLEHDLKPLDYDEKDSVKTDDVDPLKLIATHSGTADGRKIIHQNCNDLSGLYKSFYIDKFCEKYGSASKTKERFKPNQLKNNEKDKFVTSAIKVKQRLGEKWEVTQATPPVPVFKDAVMITLSESLKLQKQQAEKLKEMEKKCATERLLQNIGVKMGDKLPVTDITAYRTDTLTVDDETIEEDEESHDDSENEDVEKDFVFPVENKEN